MALSSSEAAYFTGPGEVSREQRVVQRHQPVLDADRLPHPALAPGAVHLRAEARRHVGGDADAAMAAGGVEGQRGVVLARELDEVGAAAAARVQRPGEVRRRVLHADDVPVLGEARHGVGRDVHHAAAGDVVDDHGQLHRVGDRGEVEEKPFLRRLVVVGRDHEAGVGAGLLGVAGEVDRLGGAVAARAGDHRNPAARHLDADLDDALVLLMGEGRAFAGGADGDQPLGALRDLPLHQLGELLLVHRAVLPHGRDQRDQRSLEHVLRLPPCSRRGVAGRCHPLVGQTSSRGGRSGLAATRGGTGLGWRPCPPSLLSAFLTILRPYHLTV